MSHRILLTLLVLTATAPIGWGQQKPKKKPTSPEPPAATVPLPLSPSDTLFPSQPGTPIPPTKNPVAGDTGSVDAILKRLAAIRNEREALAKEEADLKDRLKLRLKEQNELMRKLEIAVPEANVAGMTAAEKSPFYFPTVVGTERVYLIGGSEVRDVVTAVETKGAARIVTLTKPDKPDGDVRVLSVSEDKLLILRNGEYHYQTPHIALLPKAKIGETWRLFGTSEGEVHRFVGVEEVTVPAGTFQAMRVDYGEESPAGFQVSGSLWYAPGVGSIKNTRGGKDVLLLKSFKPGDGTRPPAPN